LFFCLFAILFLARISPADPPSRVQRKSSQDTHRGFGYVEFALAEDAHEAIDNMDQAELYGRVIKVNQAKPQKQAGEKLGSKTAVWEQVSFLLLLSISTAYGINLVPRMFDFLLAQIAMILLAMDMLLTLF
jgi:RNA recognition motif-containing protein